MEAIEVLTILHSYRNIIKRTFIKLSPKWLYEDVSIKSIFDRYRKGIIKKEYLRDRLSKYPDVKILFIPDGIELNKYIHLTLRPVLYDKWITSEFNRKYINEIEDGLEKYSDNIFFLKTYKYCAFAIINKYSVTLE